MKFIKKFQEGGAAPETAQEQTQGQPSGQQGGPEAQVAQMAQQIIQQLGPEAAALLAQAIVQMLQGAQGQQGGAPAYAKKGAKLVKVTKK